MRSALVLALLAGAVSCGASQKTASSPSTMPEAYRPSESGGASEVLDNRHGEIEKLSAQIDDDAGKIGLAQPQLVEPVPPAARMATVPMSTDASCKPAKTDRCDSSCKLSDAICTNASRICDLAQQLADSWSAGKCAHAKQSCDGAHEKCCTCN